MHKVRITPPLARPSVDLSDPPKKKIVGRSRKAVGIAAAQTARRMSYAIVISSRLVIHKSIDNSNAELNAAVKTSRAQALHVSGEKLP